MTQNLEVGDIKEPTLLSNGVQMSIKAAAQFENFEFPGPICDSESRLTYLPLRQCKHRFPESGHLCTSSISSLSHYAIR